MLSLYKKHLVILQNVAGDLSLPTRAHSHRPAACREQQSCFSSTKIFHSSAKALNPFDDLQLNSWPGGREGAVRREGMEQGSRRCWEPGNGGEWPGRAGTCWEGWALGAGFPIYVHALSLLSREPGTSCSRPIRQQPGVRGFSFPGSLLPPGPGFLLPPCPAPGSLPEAWRKGRRLLGMGRDTELFCASVTSCLLLSPALLHIPSPRCARGSHQHHIHILGAPS